MTKILPTQDDYEAQHIHDVLDNPDIGMDEKRALLEDPEVISIATRLGAEVGINGEAPHVMEDWLQKLEDQEKGIGTKAVPNAKNTTNNMAQPKDTNRIAMGIDQLFLQNELDEITPQPGKPEAKVVPMEQQKYLNKMGLGKTA